MVMLSHKILFDQNKVELWKGRRRRAVQKNKTKGRRELGEITGTQEEKDEC